MAEAIYTAYVFIFYEALQFSLFVCLSWRLSLAAYCVVALTLKGAQTSMALNASASRCMERKWCAMIVAKWYHLNCIHLAKPEDALDSWFCDNCVFAKMCWVIHVHFDEASAKLPISRSRSRVAFLCDNELSCIID